MAQIQNVICVIESPSAMDVYDGRKEGFALMEALRLASIPYRYFAVSDMATLDRAITDIAAMPPKSVSVRPGETPTETIYLPHLHISAHGNDAGIGLTNGDFVSWPDLALMLHGLNKSRGYLFGGKRGWACLTLSCCKGSHAKVMLPEDKPWPVLSLVATDTNIAWSDALTAWIVYYHLLVLRERKAEDALRVMNLASGAGEPFALYK